MRQAEKLFHWTAAMAPVARQRRSSLGLFPDKPVPRLYDRMIEVLRVHHHSRRTEQAYIHCVRRYIAFHHRRHPRELAEDDVDRFLTSPAVKKHVAASTQNQALSAILFVYARVLEQPLDRLECVVCARRPKRLPIVLTVDEVSRVLANLRGDKWLIAMLLYGGGLRLLEALRLRVKDLDFERGEITVREGKGDKDRVTTMPRPVVPPLEEHLRRVQAIHEPHVPAFLCDAPAGRWLRYSYSPGIAGPQRCENNDDLHPRAEPGRPRCPQPCGRHRASKPGSIGRKLAAYRYYAETS